MEGEFSSDDGSTDGTEDGTNDTTDSSDYSGFWDWLSRIVDWLADIGTGVANVPTLIVEGVKGLFVPSDGVIEEKFNNLVEDISMKCGITTYNMDSLFTQESAVEDVKGDYFIHGLGTLNLTFFDATYLKKGVGYFRPIIRGFMVLLLVFYNIRMLLSTLGINYAMHIGKAGGSDDN